VFYTLQTIPADLRAILFKKRQFPSLKRPLLLVVEDDVEERAVNLDTAVVVNEPQLPEPVHEKVHA
jgi:hypothetical protein